MPCEGCNTQFTVFRRKRCCRDCKRFYCSSCLSTQSAHTLAAPLCERCSIFAKRPLLRVDLLQLKPKDLIFYLQSKHISTAGCVEKDELVGLILNYIQETDQSSPASNAGCNSSEGNANSFDSLKQSCQNFFSNISEKVDSFAAFESAKPAKQDAANINRCPFPGSPERENVHISEQPRVSIRKIPTYASYQNEQTDDGADIQMNTTLSPALSSPPVATSRYADLQLDANPHLSAAANNQQQSNAAATTIDSVSACECFDDEIISSFRARNNSRLQSPQSACSLENPVAGPSGSCTAVSVISTAKGRQNKQSRSLKVDSYDEASSGSSFEELGAIGGISDDSRTGADNSAQSNDPWQLIDNDERRNALPKHMELDSSSLTIAVPQRATEVQLSPLKAVRPKKVTRRRSESYLIKRAHGFADESPTSPEVGNAAVLTLSCFNNELRRPVIGEVNAVYVEADGDDDNAGVNNVAGKGHIMKETSFHCKRCGKNRLNIRKYIEKMRSHLESSQMTEADIKLELDEFLVFLENRTRSIDCSDSETTAVSSMSGTRDTNCRPIMAPSPALAQLFDETEGIHVYAMPDDGSAALTDSRFINLEHIQSLEELEGLCVKQLKEVLMLNRVDYKGCCEKQELLERVARLWKNLKSIPSIDKLQTDELCKICMDAPIECVILECGHMATCTGCGKVLSECPICRQYIVRVVRFFKA